MNLHGPVRAAEDAGVGSAEVTISLDSWKDGNVAPTTHRIATIAPKSTAKSEPVSLRLVRSFVHPDRKASVWNVRFTPDGRLYAAGYPSGVVQLFDLATGKEVRRIESPRGYRGTADYANPTADFKTLYVPVERDKRVAFEQDGKKRFRITYNGELLAWDLTSGQPQLSIKPSAPDRGVMQAFLSPAGDRAVFVEALPYVPGDKSTLDFESVLIDLKTGTSKSLGPGYGMVAFTSDGKRLAITFFARKDDPSRLYVLDIATGKELWVSKPTSKGRGYGWPAVSRDDRLLVVQDSVGRIDQPGTLHVFNFASGKELAAFPSGGKYPFLQPAFSPDGRLLAATDWNGGLTVWDLNKKAVVRTRTFEAADTGHRVAFAPDGKTLAVAVMPKSKATDEREPDPADLPQPRIYVFDLTTEKEPIVLVCPHGYVGDLAFQPDGQALAFGSAGAVHLFDLRTSPKK